MDDKDGRGRDSGTADALAGRRPQRADYTRALSAGRAIGAVVKLRSQFAQAGSRE